MWLELMWLSLSKNYAITFPTGKQFLLGPEYWFSLKLCLIPLAEQMYQETIFVDTHVYINVFIFSSPHPFA